jgi:hypothetical protein
MRQCRASQILLQICFLGLSFGQKAKADNWSNAYQSSVNAVPYLFSAGGLCSGALIDESRILTAWHCVHLIRPVTVGWRDGKDPGLKATAIYKDAEHDIAVIKLDQPVRRKPLVLAPSGVAVEGLPICTIGHPFGLELQKSPDAELGYILSAGLVSKVNSKNIVTDMSLSPGNSGGPVLDVNGKIISLVSSKVSAFRAGNIGLLPPQEKVAQALTVSAKKQEPLTWKDAKNTWYLNLSLSSSLSAGEGDKKTRYKIDDYQLEWRARDRISFLFSTGGNAFAETQALYMGFNLPVKDFTQVLTWEAGAFAGYRVVKIKATDVTRKLSAPMVGIEVAMFRSALRIRAEKSAGGPEPLTMFGAYVDLLSLF